MRMQLGLLLLQQVLDHIEVLVQTWQFMLEHLPHLKVLYQVRKNPECYFFAAMIEQVAYDEIHSLYVSNSFIVSSVSHEHPF
jgi:hypothetical protein